MASFPPIHLQASHPISQSAALSRLQTYLDLSSRKENAHLLPNATLSSTGPTAKGDVAGNLVMHNLRRVEAGLRGEWLAPVLDIENSNGDMMDTAAGFETAGGENGTGEGWQDLEEYQREQSIENGEVAPDVTEVGQEGEEMQQLEPVVAAPIDKEARRRAKKERSKKERKERVKNNKNKED